MREKEALMKLFKARFHDLNLHTDEELEQMSIEELEMIATMDSDDNYR